jgi:hypothetical protein
VISDQYPGSPYGSSEVQSKEHEQKKVQARRQLIMRKHFNRVNNLPQGYFYESEEETEYASTCQRQAQETQAQESMTATCTYCIKKKELSNITKKYINNKNVNKMTYDNIFFIKQYKTISKTIKMTTKDGKPFKIILNSGASKTYFNDRKRLTNVQYKVSKIMLGNETTITCYGQGGHEILRNVSYVPNLRINLLSTKHLCIDDIDNDFLVNYNKE